MWLNLKKVANYWDVCVDILASFSVFLINLITHSYVSLRLFKIFLFPVVKPRISVHSFNFFHHFYSY